MSKQLAIHLEKAIYDSGINVALYNAEQEPEYKQFRADVYGALVEQIEAVADPEKLANLSLFKLKKQNAPLMTAVGTILAGHLLENNVEWATFLVWAGNQGGQAFLDKAGISGVFGLKNTELINYFDNYGRLMIRSVDDYSKKWIADTIQQGLDDRLNNEEIAKLLIDEGKGISKVRAQRIALTETANAMTYIELEAAKRNGIEQIQWVTSRDERVCPTCLPLDGEVVPVGQLFSAMIDRPPAHVSCRCYFIELIPEKWQPENIWIGN